MRTRNETWTRAAFALIAVLTAIRLVVVGATDWSDTEAYYVGWSRWPSLSYYDHPPLVAWTTWLVSHGIGNSAFILRLLPVLCAAIFALLLRRLAARIFSARAAFFAVAIVSALPAFEMTSLLVNPEGLLAPLWMLYLGALWDLHEHDEWWRPLALGAIIGVGFLAKYTALLGVPVAIAYLATSAPTRRWFKRSEFYFGGLVALVLATPVIVWNAERGFPSVRLHLVERAAAPSLAGYGANALHALGSQLMLFHPILLPGLVVTAWITIARARRGDEPSRFLAWTSVPVLAFFLVMMVRVSDAEPHWTMVGWVPLTIAAGALADAAMSRRIAWYGVASATFSIVVLALYFVHMASPVLLERIPKSVYDASADPINETLGWDGIRDAVSAQAEALGPRAVVASNHNVLCGHLEVALHDAPNVYCVSPRRTEFDFVGRGVVPANVPVVYVDTARYTRDPSIEFPNRDCELGKDVDVVRGDRVVQRVHIYTCAPRTPDVRQALR